MKLYVDYYNFLDLMYRSDCSTREKIAEIARKCLTPKADILMSFALEEYQKTGGDYEENSYSLYRK